ncbi:hypothetical protein LCGC14_1299760 [marine sediment metagenome]|uniref:Uncharacterized protein n=1 Tax=marine sediment metagenome TaxID=412755 RepID=A0A0F9KRK6_9ZZZZ
MDLIPQYLVKERAYTSDTGVIQIDLPKNEQISQIIVEIKATVSNTLDVTNSILHAVTKVEVLLDGAGVAYSMTPESGSYQALLTAGFVPPHSLGDIESFKDTMRLPIYFGRWPGDPNYLLDTARYKNATLQIPYVLDTTDFDTTTLEVTAYYFRPMTKVNPRGFIRSRTISEIVRSAAAGFITVDLPTGLPWRTVFFRTYDWDQHIYTDITDVKFEVDDGRLRLFDGRTEELYTLEKLHFGGAYDGNTLESVAAQGGEIATYMGAARNFAISKAGALPDIFSTVSKLGHRVAIALATHAGAGQSIGHNFYLQPTGSAYMGGLILAHFPNEAFPAPQHSDAVIEYTVGAYAFVLETNVIEVVEGVL